MKRRVALVTGSATGLGVQTVLALARTGHDVIINYRTSKDRALELKAKVEELRVRCEVIQADLAQRRDCAHLIEKALGLFETIDICVLNAGPYIFSRKKMVDYEDDEWQQMINGNLNSAFYLTKGLIPAMRKQKWGRIITFGFQQAGQAVGWKERAAFAAAKVGLASLTRTLAEEESEFGITVNMICPGDITQEHKEQRIADVTTGSLNSAPIGRPGTGEDISRIVEFLCAEESDFITGNVIEVNGGFNIFTKRAKS